MTSAADLGSDLVALKAALDEFSQRIVALERENKILREENALLKQGRFGKSSERMEPGQLALFAAEQEALAPAACETLSIPAHERHKRGHGRAPFAAHLPRVTIECDVPVAERSCSTCGKEMRSIGEDVSERGHIVPARIVVNRYVRKKYACSAGHGVVTAAAPAGVIEGAKYEASVFAHVATAKYSDHTPLNRLEGIFKRQGVHLPKQTMWDMLVRLDELVAQPVLRQMRVELLGEAVLHADETPVTMRLEDGKGSREGYAWCWRNLRESEVSKSLFEFCMTRSRAGPLGFLGEWSGTLIIDGYSGYNEVALRNGIVRAGCWAHARRKLKKALDVGTKAAAEVLAPVQRLFWIERAIQRRAEREGLAGDALLELRACVRAKRSQRVVARIYAIAADLAGRRATLPESKLGKALTYLDRQREPLTVFLDDPRIPIHNNDCERDVRHLAVGRKNWVIFASERGGDVATSPAGSTRSCCPAARPEPIPRRTSRTRS